MKHGFVKILGQIHSLKIMFPHKPVHNSWNYKHDEQPPKPPGVGDKLLRIMLEISQSDDRRLEAH